MNFNVRPKDVIPRTLNDFLENYYKWTIVVLIEEEFPDYSKLNFRELPKIKSISTQQVFKA